MVRCQPSSQCKNRTFQKTNLLQFKHIARLSRTCFRSNGGWDLKRIRTHIRCPRKLACAVHVAKRTTSSIFPSHHKLKSHASQTSWQYFKLHPHFKVFIIIFLHQYRAMSHLRAEAYFIPIAIIYLYLKNWNFKFSFYAWFFLILILLLSQSDFLVQLFEVTPLDIKLFLKDNRAIFIYKSRRVRIKLNVDI